MAKHTPYFSVSKAQWQHIGFNEVHSIRAKKNKELNAVAIQKRTKTQKDKALADTVHPAVN